jgi:hypothetical protein
MKALIYNSMVIQIEQVAFETHKDYLWIDCGEDVQVGYFYLNDAFIPPPPVLIQPASPFPTLNDKIEALWAKVVDQDNTKIENIKRSSKLDKP